MPLEKNQERYMINYETREDFKKAFSDLVQGKVSSIPCTACKEGRIHADPIIPLNEQAVFYCDKCNNKIIQCFNKIN